MNKKIIIIGVDGGSFDIIYPLIEQGRLPNFQRLTQEGSYGRLCSTFPPMTFPAWNTFMTGVNPGTHGVFDFTEHLPGKYAIAFTNAQSRKSKTMWRIMSDMGRRVAVMGLPVTYPPESVNGIMISGFDTPVGGMADESVFHPPDLKKELEDSLGGYEVTADIAHAIDSMNPELALKRIHETLQKKSDAALYLHDKEAWDCFMVLFGESDLVGHHFWQFHDPNSPFHTREVSEVCRDGINLIYEHIDQTLGAFLDRMDEDTTLLIMSDHGFGGNSNRTFYLNRWLEKEKFLSFLPEKKLNKFLISAKNLGLKYLPHSIKVNLFRKISILADTTESMIRFSGIEWDQTLAYSEETPYYPTIWLNLKGREPKGLVSPSEYEDVLQQIVSRLGKWKDPDTGKPVFQNIYRKSDIYSGSQLDKAPDILLEPNYINGYSYLSRPSRNKQKDVCLDYISQDEIKTSVMQNKSGSHRKHGIFFGYGSPFQAGKIMKNAGLIDLAPTVFSLMGLSVPDAWEGKSLVEGSVSKKAQMDLSISQRKVEYTEKEAALLEKRMRDLGYME